MYEEVTHMLIRQRQGKPGVYAEPGARREVAPSEREKFHLKAFKLGPLDVDPCRKPPILINGRPLLLSTKETATCYILLVGNGRMFPTEELATIIRSKPPAVRKFVCHIRQKMASCAPRPSKNFYRLIIETVEKSFFNPQSGYRLNIQIINEL